MATKRRKPRTTKKNRQPSLSSMKEARRETARKLRAGFRSASSQPAAAQEIKSTPPSTMKRRRVQGRPAVSAAIAKFIPPQMRTVFTPTRLVEAVCRDFPQTDVLSDDELGAVLHATLAEPDVSRDTLRTVLLRHLLPAYRAKLPPAPPQSRFRRSRLPSHVDTPIFALEASEDGRITRIKPVTHPPEEDD
jgi:hypothetical protein